MSNTVVTRVSDPVVAEILLNFETQRNSDVKRIEKLEDRWSEFDKEYIHNNYKLKELISDAVKQGMEPVIRQAKDTERRVKELEDRPKTLSHKFTIWLIGSMGAVIVALLIALVRTSLNI